MSFLFALALSTLCLDPLTPASSLAPMLPTAACAGALDSGEVSAHLGPDPVPLGPIGRWKLIFADEFTGATIDTTRWHTSYPWGGIKGEELEEYVPQGVTLSGGVLHLTAAPKPNDLKHPYTSGMLATWGKLNLTRGTVVEARVRTPTGPGLWPAIWLHASSGKWPPEIDILEVRGHEPAIWLLSAHWAEKGAHQSIGFRPKNDAYASDFHTVTMQWDSTQIVWFIDGVRQGLVTEPERIPNEPMYLIVNFAIGGGGWSGKPDATTQFPSTFDIDYVRVWRAAP